MNLKYLTSYKISRNGDDSSYSIKNFKEHALNIKRKLPDDIFGVEIRLVGDVFEKGRIKRITSGPSISEIKDVSDFVNGEFNRCVLHLSKFGLAVLQGAPVGSYNLKDPVDFVENNFDFVVGHYGVQESLWGQTVADSYLQKLSRDEALRNKKSFTRNLSTILRNDLVPLNVSRKFLIENGFETYNIKSKVHEYARKNGLNEATDLGHFIMGNFDEDPKMGGAKHDTLESYVNKSGTHYYFRTGYLQKLGENTRHLHVHGCMREYQKSTEPVKEVFRRYKDHQPFIPNNVSFMQKSLMKRIISGALPTLESCTIELEKSVNSLENISASIKNFKRWF